VSPLGRKNEPQRERSEEEREAARLEREARRAAREGRPLAADGRPEPEPELEAEAEAGPPDAMSVAPEERATAPEPAAPEPPATARAWREAAGTPEPDPPLVRRVPQGSAAPAAAIETADEPLPEPAPTEPPPRRIPPAPPLPFDGGEDRPIGTRRVSALGRISARRGEAPSAVSPPPPPPPASPPPAPAPGRRRRRPMVWIGGILAVLAVAFLAWFALSLFQPFTGDGSGTVFVKIPPGATADDVGDLLEQRGVIDSSFFFGLRARLAGKRNEIKAGTFRLKNDMSYGAALDTVTHTPPPPPVIRLTIPEGKSRAEIAPIARQAGVRGDYLKASAHSTALNPRSFGAPRSAKTLEGFLFPATYEFKPGVKAPKLVSEQLGAFRANLAKINLRAAHRKNLNVYDVVTIASMIEREAAVAKDRPLIAAVIYNRLKDGMPLGIDATLRYALNNWSRPLRVSELNSDSPYNTRKHAGLPPTPIGNPGLASLRAAARPAHVPYLFYVIKPCGNGAHAFSSTDAQFERDVAAYNRARAKQGGKSPVTCK
jgi:uncharacterized YceG family protein